MVTIHVLEAFFLSVQIASSATNQSYMSAFYLLINLITTFFVCKSYMVAKPHSQIKAKS